jgi:hypothetical protein
MSVSLTLIGTDPDGGSISETLVFDSTWADNTAPAEAEKPEQGIITTAVFAAASSIGVDARVDDGPLSAIVVEVVPEPVYEDTAIEGALHVARFFWDGFRIINMLDKREVAPNLKIAGRPRYEIVAESTLAHHAFWPAGSDLVVFHFGDDSENMRNSDQLLTRRWALRERQDSDDPTLISASTEGEDAVYYSRAFRPPFGSMSFINVTLLGKARPEFTDAGGSRVQIRYTLDTDPGAWFPWESLNNIQGPEEYQDSRAISFFLNNPLVSLYKYQIRIVGRWASFMVVISNVNLRANPFDVLVRSLNDAFAVQHWSPGIPILEGTHKAISITEVAAGLRFLQFPQAFDSSNNDSLQTFVGGYTILGAPITAFSIATDGDVEVGGSLDVGSFIAAIGNITGNELHAVDLIECSLDAIIHGNTTSSNYLYENVQEVFAHIPLAAVASEFEAIDPGVSLNVNSTGITPTDTGFIGIPVGGSLIFTINPWLIHGATLKEVRIVATSHDGTDIDLVGTTDIASLLTTDSNHIVVGLNQTITVGGAAGNRQTFVFSPIDLVINLYNAGASLYRLSFVSVSSTTTCRIYQIVMVLEVDRVEKPLRIPFPV